MKEFPFKIYLISSLIAVIVAITSIVIYHNYYDEPTIIFNENVIAKNVSYQNKSNVSTPINFTSIIEKTISSIVFIRTVRKGKDGMLSYDTGSGVFISPSGQIVTNLHVIKDAEKIIVSTYNNITYEAELIATDDQTDIAVIKINDDNLPFVFFGDSEDVKVGDWILVIGNPFKLNNSVSAGIVSAKNRTLDLLGTNSIDSYIQTDAAANPGNSGGAMIDLSGKMVGMISAIATDADNFQGYSFAIPSNIVKKVAFDLINYGVVQRAWMGVSITNAIGNNGVLLERVNENSAADVAGLISGDIITFINDFKIINRSNLEGILAQYKPGDTIIVNYTRNSIEKKVKVVLKNIINTTDLVANRNDKILKELGFILRELTQKEKNTLNNNGVMVVSVIHGSKMNKINLEPGYIIQILNDEPIQNVDDLIVKYKASKSKVQLKGIYKNYPGEFSYVFKKGD